MALVYRAGRSTRVRGQNDLPLDVAGIQPTVTLREMLLFECPATQTEVRAVLQDPAYNFDGTDIDRIAEWAAAAAEYETFDFSFQFGNGTAKATVAHVMCSKENSVVKGSIRLADASASVNPKTRIFFDKVHTRRVAGMRVRRTVRHRHEDQDRGLTAEEQDQVMVKLVAAASVHVNPPTVTSATNFSTTAAAEHTGEFGFCLGAQNDLYIIKYAGASATELHTLSARSNYATFARQTSTGLHKSQAKPKQFTFGLGPGSNLLALKATPTALEAHRLTHSSDYQAFDVHAVTALRENIHTNRYSLLVAANGDIFAIKMNGTGTSSTEVHVLSATTEYSQFSMQTGTALHESTRSQFAFALGPNNDLFAIKKRDTGSGMTEVHVLSAESNYQRFTIHVASGLHETDGSWTFLVASNRDLYCIATGVTGSKRTEVHVLSAASNYADFALHAVTGLHPVSQPEDDDEL